MKPTLLGCIILFFICCSKEDTQCKTIARIIGNGGIYSLHFDDGTSYLNLRDTTNYVVSNEFCDVDSEFIHSQR